MVNYSAFEGETFLVTGGAGFIGSNIVEKLLEKNIKVRVLDNFSTGKRENIEDYLNNPNFQLITGDIRDMNICNEACKNIDYVLHQAALGSVPRSIKDPITSNEVNVNGTLNLLVAARDNKVKKFVYASSSSVYGDEPSLPKSEHKVGQALSPYSVSKKAVEMYSKIFHDIYGLNTVGLRYFNVFGKRQDPNSVYAAVIPHFVKTLLNNKQPVINGDGLQSRDFTYVDNVVQANLKACVADENAMGEVFNIACGGRIFLKDLYNVISKLLNKNIEPIFGPDRDGDIKHSNADISKAKKFLNYMPLIDINEGLEKTIQWYKDNLTFLEEKKFN